MATAEPVPAGEVKAGDVLALPGAPSSTVTGVTGRSLRAAAGAADVPVLHIDLGPGGSIVRLPSEAVFRLIPAGDG